MDFVDTQPGGNFAGARDGMERLWTPHRMAYVESLASDDNSCPFCSGPTREDADALIVARGATCFAVLNLYPYNPGHLLICPYRHVGYYTDLNDDEVIEVAKMTQEAMHTLRRASDPAGFNIGINQGGRAGAGIADHFHQHVVPRWSGDANFFPIIAQTKALPQLLGETRQILVDQWGAQ
ncbi:MAG: HIT domain-containing protein [Propionibacteriaceae bacterium]|nr:HIT domain-containing protein [Propionibacteriaceae bacterium]